MAKPVKDEIYTFRNIAYPKKYLNLYSTGTAGNGMNVCLWSEDSSNEQRWLFDGTKLRPMTNNSFALDKYTATGNANNGNADIWTDDDATNQDVVFDDTGLGTNQVKIKLASGSYYLNCYSNTGGEGNGSSAGKTSLSDGNVFWTSSKNATSSTWEFAKVGGSSGGGGTTPSGGQKLISPLNTAYVTTGYLDDAPAYPLKFNNAKHYGIDFSGSYSTKDVLSCGIGRVEVIKIYDPNGGFSLGNMVVVKYDDVLDINGKNRNSVVVRYCHLKNSSIVVRVGQDVVRGQKLAIMGDTVNQGAVHLHMEISSATSDLANSWQSPTHKYNVSTINPFELLHKTSQQILKPDSAKGASNSYGGELWYNEAKIYNAPTIN